MPHVADKPKRSSLPHYDFGDILSVPVKDRIGMTEGHRLKPDEPNAGLLFDWCTNGRLIKVDDGALVRLKLPSFIGPGGRRYTTEDAFRWWVQNLNQFNRYRT